MNTLVKSILCLALASLLLSARPTSAAVFESSGTCPNDPAPAASSHGAVEAPQDPAFLTDDIPEAIQKALVELEGRRREVAALRLAVGVRDDKIRILESIIAQQTEIIAQWKTAATERAGANGIDAKIEASLQKSVEKYDAELERVRRARDKQAAQKKWWGLGGVVVGVVVTIAVVVTGKD